ncbi:hypothetical protein HMPREF9120_02668 [Neisseria sp. oral taxon 020 str. F0370]|nr:hypothetical protein HMPREF9120_02668 [Neisseria sp. oral taxon 020 str. F0370]
MLRFRGRFFNGRICGGGAFRRPLRYNPRRFRPLLRPVFLF